MKTINEEAHMNIFDISEEIWNRTFFIPVQTPWDMKAASWWLFQLTRLTFSQDFVYKINETGWTQRSFKGKNFIWIFCARLWLVKKTQLLWCHKGECSKFVTNNANANKRPGLFTHTGRKFWFRVNLYTRQFFLFLLWCAELHGCKQIQLVKVLNP